MATLFFVLFILNGFLIGFYIPTGTFSADMDSSAFKRKDGSWYYWRSSDSFDYYTGKKTIIKFRTKEEFLWLCFITIFPIIRFFIWCKKLIKVYILLPDTEDQI